MSVFVVVNLLPEGDKFVVEQGITYRTPKSEDFSLLPERFVASETSNIEVLVPWVAKFNRNGISGPEWVPLSVLCEIRAPHTGLIEVGETLAVSVRVRRRPRLRGEGLAEEEIIKILHRTLQLSLICETLEP